MFRSVFIRFAILMGCAVGMGDDSQAASQWHEGQSGAKARHSRPDLPLESEKTFFRETGRYAEVERLCDTWTIQFPRTVACEPIGKTAEGRSIRSFVISRSGALTPHAAVRRNLPVVLVIAGTHSGEIDGKDASLAYFRDVLNGNVSGDFLKHVIVVLVPVFNVDGHERRGRFQRPNQEGPLEQGERTTARRINLNRDWMLAQTPEMRSMLSLVRKWDPTVTIDLHVTDGLRFRHDVSLTVAPEFGGDPDLTSLAKDFLNEALVQLHRSGHQPLGFYPRLKDVNDPKAGLVLDVDSPRFSHSYAAMRNRLGVLVEDYAWASYDARVETCKDSLKVLLALVAGSANTLMAAARNADRHGDRLGGQAVSLDFETASTFASPEAARTIDILGYRYVVHANAPVVGGRHISYSLDQPETWHVPFFDDVQPLPGSTPDLPKGGYIVPVAWAGIVRPFLDQHGLTYRVLTKGQSSAPVQSLRARSQNLHFDAVSFQGRQQIDLKGEWHADRVTIEKGALFVPVGQAKGLLVAHLLEPGGPDSLSAWGLFNSAYEISDYLANHRAFELASWMYEGNEKIGTLFGEEIAGQLPALRVMFEARLEADEAFKANPDARLDFWISQLPVQDQGLNLYPILRSDRLVD